VRGAFWFLALIGWSCWALADRPAALAQDDDAALAAMPDHPGKEEVFYTCNACHSIHLVTQQRLSRERWDQLLDYMVEEQGMAELTAEQRRVILEYLATQYGQNSPRSSANDAG
jgi:cytochrome c